MIHGVIVLRVRTMLQKAFTVGSKSYWCEEFWGEYRFINAVDPAVKDQTLPRGLKLAEKRRV